MKYSHLLLATLALLAVVASAAAQSGKPQTAGPVPPLVPDWVDPQLPAPDAQGWIKVYESGRVFGANPTNASILSGNVMIKGGLLIMDSVGGYNGGLRISWKGTNVAVRFRGRKISGRHLQIGFGAFVAWYDGESLCGLGQNFRGKYSDLKTAHLRGKADDFFDMEFQLVRDKLKLLINGVARVEVTAPWVDEFYKVEISSFKAVGAFKKIELKPL